MIIHFSKTGEINGSNFVRIPLRSNAILNIENIEKHCFLWSILVSLHPCNFNHPKRVSKFKQYFNEKIIQGFDFTNRFDCSDVHKFKELNN